MSVLTRRSIGAAATAAALVIGVAAPAQAATRHYAGREYFLITIADNTQVAVAHGAFAGSGRDVEHSSSDTVYLGGGKVEIYHPDNKSHFTDHVNRKTCFISFTITGQYTLGGGTGRFAGLTGHGSYVVKEQAVLARRKNGACNMNAEPTHFAGYVRAGGPTYRS